MDRDTMQEDLDLIIGPSRDAQLPGEWDWEPPLGTTAPVASSTAQPTEPEESETETEGDPEDGATDDEEDD